MIEFPLFRRCNFSNWTTTTSFVLFLTLRSSKISAGCTLICWNVVNHSFRIYHNFQHCSSKCETGYLHQMLMRFYPPPFILFILTFRSSEIIDQYCVFHFSGLNYSPGMKWSSSFRYPTSLPLYRNDGTISGLSPHLHSPSQSEKLPPEIIIVNEFRQ